MIGHQTFYCLMNEHSTTNRPKLVHDWAQLVFWWIIFYRLLELGLFSKKRRTVWVGRFVAHIALGPKFATISTLKSFGIRCVHRTICSAVPTRTVWTDRGARGALVTVMVERLAVVTPFYMELVITMKTIFMKENPIIVFLDDLSDHIIIIIRNFAVTATHVKY